VTAFLKRELALPALLVITIVDELQPSVSRIGSLVNLSLIRCSRRNYNDVEEQNE